MRRGFTLVEISIVLVIIGLLVGGILVGQSLIDSAKVNSFVREFQQYRIMVEQFEDRYRGLPGDTRLFPVTGRGTAVAGDGMVQDSTPSTGEEFTGEIAHFWKHLSDANMINDDYSEDASSGIVAGDNTPEIVYDNLGLVPLTLKKIDQLTPSVTYTSINIQYFWVSDFSSTNSTAINMEPGLTPTEALAIDVKLDDGFALVDGNASKQTEWIFDASTPNCIRTTSVFPKYYDVEYSDRACMLWMRYK